MKSPALQFITHAWNHIPHDSWRRLNGGMYSALSNAVGSGMKFAPGDLKTIAHDFRSHYWIVEGEGLYAAACGGRRGDFNLSAAIAFETWWKREPWLWAEDSKTPTRLHVGARFTWKGRLVTITSFDDGKQSLTACTYKERAYDVSHVDGDYRRLVSERIDKKKYLTRRYSPPIEEHHYESSKIDKRFTITHAELMAVRKAADGKVRKYLKKMKAAADADALEAVQNELRREPPGHFRHFDIETLRAAYSARVREIEKAIQDIKNAALRAGQEKVWAERQAQLAKTHDADLQRWLNGEELDRHFDVVRLRIKGEWVETSTMQRATITGARRGLRFVFKHRAAGWQANGETQSVDQFPIKAITSEKVIVGCTEIPISEVDRLAKLFNKMEAKP